MPARARLGADAAGGRGPAPRSTPAPPARPFPPASTARSSSRSPAARSRATSSARRPRSTSNQHTLAWTAGHCVNDAQFGGGFATNWTFIPGYRNGEQPFGDVARARSCSRPRPGATTPTSARTSARAGSPATRRAEGSRTRSAPAPIAFNALAHPAVHGLRLSGRADPVRADLRRPAPLHAATPRVTGSDSPPGNGPETMQIDCDMSGGASGGGWVNALGGGQRAHQLRLRARLRPPLRALLRRRGASSSTSRRRARRCSAAGRR